MIWNKIKTRLYFEFKVFYNLMQEWNGKEQLTLGILVAN